MLQAHRSQLRQIPFCHGLLESENPGICTMHMSTTIFPYIHPLTLLYWKKDATVAKVVDSY